MSLICCRNLFVFYEKVLAVENLSFEISKKDYIFIVGENGSGKSTLIKAILGLKANSVFEIVLSGFVNSLKIFPFFKLEQKAKAMDFLRFLNMERFKNVSFRKLSKGQQQKVLLARAFCSTKKILFLDEPCSSLDPVFRKEFYFLVKKFNEEKNIAIVMVSHDIEAAFVYAKKILHMKKKALFFGSVDEYLKSDVSRQFWKGERNFDGGNF